MPRLGLGRDEVAGFGAGLTRKDYQWRRYQRPPVGTGDGGCAPGTLETTTTTTTITTARTEGSVRLRFEAEPGRSLNVLSRENGSLLREKRYKKAMDEWVDNTWILQGGKRVPSGWEPRPTSTLRAVMLLLFVPLWIFTAWLWISPGAREGRWVRCVSLYRADEGSLVPFRVRYTLKACD